MQERSAFFKRLSGRYASPRLVQKLLRAFAYNHEEQGETCRSALATWKARKAHCLEAAFLSAAILEHKGYPPLVMSLESEDQLDHVLFVFQQKGLWGSVGRSRDEGLHGRAPRFRSLRDLAWSYVDPYVDKTGRVTGYGLANLDDSKSRWRDSPTFVWKAERHLIDLPHKDLRYSNKRHHLLKARYHRDGQHPRQPFWW
jgi:hypothetical protein